MHVVFAKSFLENVCRNTSYTCTEGVYRNTFYTDWVPLKRNTTGILQEVDTLCGSYVYSTCKKYVPYTPSVHV